MRTHVEFFVADMATSVSFYQALGFELVRHWGDWALLDRDGARLALQSDTYARTHPHYFSSGLDGRRGVGVEVPIDVGDLEAVHAIALGLGGAVVKDITERPWGARDFRVADPDGYFLRFTTPLDDGEHSRR